MEGYPVEKFNRIKAIIKEENNKRQATDNYNIRFMQLRLYVNDMLERGFSFKQPKVEKQKKNKIIRGNT